MFTTGKIYYDRQWSPVAETRWRRIDDTHIALETSVAFPEGGGQLGDSGFVSQGAIRLPFRDTQKKFGRTVFLPDFPTIQVEGEVHLELDGPGDGFDETKPILVELDRARRGRLTRSHTAAHLVYGGLMQVVENITSRTMGCYIQPDEGRFDIATDKIGADDLARITDFCGNWVAQNHAIEMSARANEPECRIWSCNGLVIPCGGLHLPTTGDVGSVSVRRKNKGKGIERIYYQLDSPCPESVLSLFPKG